MEYQEALQNEELEVLDLMKTVTGVIPDSAIKKGNRDKSWARGYNDKYDVIIISKDGTIGEIVEINSVKIALPAVPKDVFSRSSKPSEQYWEPEEVPPALDKLTMYEWESERSEDFKRSWLPYIDRQFDLREFGFWFMNNGKPTYVTGNNWMYLQWTKIDVGLPYFRESNRIFFIYWEAAWTDSRSFGICYLKNRRSGASFMGSSTAVNLGSLVENKRIGMLSKTGADARALFTGKVVPISMNYPFFFKPVQDGMDRPKTEIAYRVPALRMTRKNMKAKKGDGIDTSAGLNTSIDWKATANNSYDSEKLYFLLHDESGKWLKPNNILVNWGVTRTCLRLGPKKIGKCMMVSTSNSLSEGGEEYQKLYEDSDPRVRSKIGETKSGMYSLFIPMEWNTEGFIDRHGHPVLRTPKEPVMGEDGEMISIGVIDWWESEVEMKKGDPAELNEFYRQFPRKEEHAFRDESGSSHFNLNKIYDQVDYNSIYIKKNILMKGNFHWRSGEPDTEAVWSPDSKGRFTLSWMPPPHMRNNFERNPMGLWIPKNDHVGAFGIDSYDISGTVGGFGSKGAMSGLTKFHMEDGPSNTFFLEYCARPATAEKFFLDMLLAMCFFGMPALIENNKPRLLYYLKNNGYRKFALNRPDKNRNQLSVTERELGGIPNTSDAVKEAHATAIETYIEQYVGYDHMGEYRPPDEIGDMYFNRTLNDWAKFDIMNRTKFDLSISSGLAIMACKGPMKKGPQKQDKISINFARYDNRGTRSQIIRNG